MDAPRRLLLIALPGVLPSELDAGRTPTLHGHGHGLTPLVGARPGRPLAGVIPDDATATLRGLGISVERQALVMRPAWRGDAGLVEAIARRPHGQATVTAVVLRDPLEAAAAHGPGSRAHRAALDQAEQQARTLAALPPGPAEPWVLGTGPLLPVARTLDLEDVLARLPRAVRRHVAVEVTPARARLRLASWTAVEALRPWLENGPLAAHADVRGAEAPPEGLGLRPGELLLEARPGIAFGPRRLHARLHARDAEASWAAFPHTTPRPRTSPRGLAAAVLMAAARCAVPAGEATPVPDPAVDELPDLRPLLGGDGTRDAARSH